MKKILLSLILIGFISCRVNRTQPSNKDNYLFGSSSYELKYMVITNNKKVIFSDTVVGEPIFVNKIKSDKPFDVDTYIVYWCKNDNRICSRLYDFDEQIQTINITQ